MKTNTKAKTNKEIILNIIRLIIKDYDRLLRNPSLGIKKKGIKAGIKIFTGRCPICEGSIKPCQLNPEKCILSCGSEFGCQKLKTALTKDRRIDLHYLEMRRIFWAKLKANFTALDSSMFHKKMITHIWDIVKIKDKESYQHLRLKK